MSLWVGETLLFGTEESMKYGQGRQVPRARPSLGLWVGPPPAAILQSLTGGRGVHRHWDICILAPVPLERLLPQAGQSLLLSATFLLLRLYFNKKNLTMQVGSCIHLQVS